jgi:hypothetical protein
MINRGKCPGCQKTIAKARFETIEILEGVTPAYKGVSFICPSYSCVLGVGVDPIALKAEIVDEVVVRVRRGA